MQGIEIARNGKRKENASFLLGMENAKNGK